MFGDICNNSKGWPTESFTTHVSLTNGRAYKQNELLKQGKYRVLRVGNFFTNDSWYYSDLELDNSKYCDNGDLLYAWSASFGPRIWDGEKVIYHYHIWKVSHDDSFNRLFLYYYLGMITYQLKHGVHGSTMVHLTKEGMEKLVLAVPPKALQDSFASFMEQVDKSKINSRFAVIIIVSDYSFYRADLKTPNISFAQVMLAI